MADVDNVLNEITQSMPEPSSVADILQQKAEAELQENEPEKIEQQNQTFNKDGTPRKKRGRKPKTEAVVNTSRLGGVASAGERAIAADDAERLAAAILITKCMEMSGIAIAGDGAKMFPQETENLSNCWEKYLRKMGINDIPPGIAVTLFTIQYYSRVLVQPEAKPFTQKIVGKIKNIFYRLKGMNNARIDSRNDGERENNAGEKTASNVSIKKHSVFGS